MNDSQSILAALRDGRIARDAALQGLRAAAAGASPAPAPAPAPAAAPAAPDAIAIVGAAGRYPEAPDLDSFWRNLAAARDSVGTIPPERWDSLASFDPSGQRPDSIYSRALGVLDDADCFDAAFFQISPAEAEYMDPQHRLFLQEAYRSFEDAGYGPQRLAGQNCGVYLGIMSSEYSSLLMQSGAPVANATGNALSIAASRIAYLLNLKGPAIAIDTACSSSLVAVHLACQALRSGEIDMALAGGVTLYLSREAYLAMCGAGMLSPDGRCKAFDDGANGFVPGEGVGAVVLKRLADARRDGDRVLGTILASGINQDGRTNGITAPSGASQAALLRTVYQRHGIDPASIGYCELHGTGTRLGDPVELNAIAQVYGAAGAARQSCLIGSVKSNIGHTSAAAGVAGLHKLLLALRHGQIPPSLHFQRPNAHFDFSQSPFRVATELTPWTAPRRAALSSFGLSGTNAHLVLQEDSGAAPRAGSGAGLVVLSAHSDGALRDYAAALARQLEADPGVCLADLAYTLQVGRAALRHRLGVVASDAAPLRAALLAAAQGLPHAALLTGRAAAEVPDGDGAALAADFAAGRWTALAQAWVAGADCDWLRWQQGGGRRTVAAPTYPFARSRYWLPGQPTLAPAAPQLWQWQWQPAPLAAAAAMPPAVLLYVAACAANRALAEALAALWPQAELRALDASAPDQDWPARAAIIDLTARAEPQLARAQWLAQLQNLLGRLPADGGTVLLGLGFGRPRADALHAGLYGTLQSEYPRLRARYVDLGAELPAAALAPLLAAECAEDSRAARCRYRDGVRSLPRLAPWTAPAGAADARLPGPADVWWISGGTRGLGLLCARHLARRYGVRRMLLSSRTALPPRAQWPAATAEGIAELEALGVQFEFSAVALNDLAALRAEQARVAAVLGPVTGLLHCAGVSDWSVPALLDKSTAAMQAVFEPKQEGLDHLSAVLDNGALRHLLLFSSVASALPALGAGQIDYAMANAYLDGYAQEYAGTAHCVSIQWPSWAESGMGAVRSQAYRDSGLLTLSDAQGLDCLDRILAWRAGPLVLPAAVDPARWQPERALLEKPAPQPVAAAVAAAAAVQGAGAPAAAAGPLLAWLQNLFARELKLAPEAIEAQLGFQDYGVDSIMLTRIMRPLNQLAEQPLEPSLLFEYATLDSLAGWLLRERPGLVQKVLASAAPAPASPAALPASPAAAPAVPAAAAAPAAGGDIAIIGLSCRLPGAPDGDAYWRLLSEGRSGIVPVPAARWGHPSGFHAGVLDSPAGGDAAAFGIDADDARAMDPQALLLLELGLQAVYHAGYTPPELKGRALGVFLGARSQHRPAAELIERARNPIVAAGPNYLAANLSQYFDWQGPSLVVDTACSSALVALKLAAQALRDGEIEAAMVGGVSLLQSDAGHRLFAQRGCWRRKASSTSSTAAPRAWCWARAPAWCCSSRWRRPRPTVTASTRC
ncbi:KR domain-containing protein [Massilia sp. MB5]|nr:type I polyketide synthase [Massilia sp. MB5]UMR29440.1 KR domain-containing protein [Massilia sp. MB5]